MRRKTSLFIQRNIARLQEMKTGYKRRQEEMWSLITRCRQRLRWMSLRGVVDSLDLDFDYCLTVCSPSPLLTLEFLTKSIQTNESPRISPFILMYFLNNLLLTLLCIHPQRHFFSYLDIRTSSCVEQPPHFVKPHVTLRLAAAHTSLCAPWNQCSTPPWVLLCRFRLEAPAVRSQRESGGMGKKD